MRGLFPFCPPGPLTHQHDSFLTVSHGLLETHTHTLTHNKPGLTACSALPCTTHIFLHTHVPPAVILMTTTLSSHRLWVKLTPVICLSWSFSHLSFFRRCLFCFSDKSVWLALTPAIKGSRKVDVQTHTHKHTRNTNSCTFKWTPAC